SQELTQQQDELRRSNVELEKQALELEEKARLLAEQNTKVEVKNREVEQARRSLEEKAEQLSTTAKEVEYAKTIYASGGDLLTLINEILDLSKVEAGKMPIDPRDIHPTEIADFVDRSFRPLAEQKGLGFSVDVEMGVARSLYTDPQRLQQVLKNLLANAFKFTAEGSVTLRIHRPGAETHFSNPSLAFERVVAFSVVDTGIGIPENKQG